MSATREFYIPKGAIKVADKLSDAIAYLYSTKGAPCARVFYGNQSKPVQSYMYRSEAEREASVRRAFEARQQHKARVVEARKAPSNTAKRNAALKRLLEAKYGKGKVRVTGDTGTAYGWVRVKFLFPQNGARYGEAQHKIIQMAKAAGLSIGTYSSDGMGDHYELAVSWSD